MWTQKSTLLYSTEYALKTQPVSTFSGHYHYCSSLHKDLKRFNLWYGDIIDSKLNLLVLHTVFIWSICFHYLSKNKSFFHLNQPGRRLHPCWPACLYPKVHAPGQIQSESQHRNIIMIHTTCFQLTCLLP